ncbi:hypothetical protein EYR38_007802 [Pleurotus pulmonarius]|nr:hypothetical protein EYR38_007802 [Pleurotus pulmonarius]
MGKAKLTFELELPADANFASDYYRAVAALRKLQRDVSKSSDIRNLLVDASPNTNIKFGAPLFRNKLDENDEENLPEGNIADVVDKGPSPSRKRKMSDDDGSPTDSTTELIEGMNKATVVGGTDEAEAANIEKLPDVVAVGVKSNRNRPKQILKA